MPRLLLSALPKVGCDRDGGWMLRPDQVPDNLKHGPFTIEQAEAAGVSRFQLRGATWRRLARGIYAWAGLNLDFNHRLQALARRVPPTCAFSCHTAAWIYRLDDPPADIAAAEVTAPPNIVVPRRADLHFRRSTLADDDVTFCWGLPVTSPVRTCFDLARFLPLADAVAAGDVALHRRLLRLEELREYIARRPRWRGIRRARRVVDLLEPNAESPMESRLRLLLVLRGLPQPEARVSICNGNGAFVARLDLFYRSASLGIEYDGATHRNSLAADAHRLNRLLRAGISVLRYTASDVYKRPGEVVQEVRAELHARTHAGIVRP